MKIDDAVFILYVYKVDIIYAIALTLIRTLKITPNDMSIFNEMEVHNRIPFEYFPTPPSPLQREKLVRTSKISFIVSFDLNSRPSNNQNEQNKPSKYVI